MAAHNELGMEGELQAAKYLLANNYEILETNWQFSHAEIDIIARKNGVLVFVEVKTRRNKAWGNPEDFVSRRKLQLFMDAAYSYMEKVDHDWEIRFDVIAILIPKKKELILDHFKDAFVP